MFISGQAAFSNCRGFYCFLFCFFIVIGGKNVYLELSVNEACDKKDFVWEELQDEVPFL